MTILHLDKHHPRLVCECCELPTMEAVAYSPDDLADHPDFGTDCPLCEWENAPADRHGNSMDTDPAHAAERNGGHTLAEAQANFRKFLSMYDPSNPEPWMPAPPSHEEIRSKEELVRLYKKVLDPFGVSDAGLLDQIEQLEGELATAAQARTDAAVDLVATDDEDEADEEGDDGDGNEETPAAE